MPNKRFIMLIQRNKLTSMNNKQTPHNNNSKIFNGFKLSRILLSLLVSKPLIPMSCFCNNHNFSWLRQRVFLLQSHPELSINQLPNLFTLPNRILILYKLSNLWLDQQLVILQSSKYLMYKETGKLCISTKSKDSNSYSLEYHQVSIRRHLPLKRWLNFSSNKSIRSNRDRQWRGIIKLQWWMVDLCQMWL
jgi:hypothetical protein